MKERATGLQPRIPGESIKVAETVLRRRRDQQENKQERLKRLEIVKKKVKDDGKDKVKSAQHFLKHSIQKKKDILRVKQIKKRPARERVLKGDLHSVYCLIRNNRPGGSDVTKGALKNLGLLQPYSCTFIPNDKNAAATIRQIGPFVFYGFVSAASIKRLVTTRGQISVNNERQSINGNQVVEAALGKFGIICVDDLIDEISSCGEHFKDIMDNIRVFQLSNLRKVEGIQSKKISQGFLRNFDEKLCSIC